MKWFALALLVGGCSPWSAVEHERSPRLRRQRRLVTEAVVLSQRAAIERHHLGPAMRAWAEHGHFTLARGPLDASTDLRLSHGRLTERRVQLLHHPAPLGRRIRYSSAKWELVGSHAKFSATLEISDPGAQRWYREQYDLWLSDMGWVITSCRRWPLRSRVAGRVRKYGFRGFGALDDEVEATAPRSAGRASALWRAWRFQEAVVAARSAAAAVTDKAAKARAWARVGRYQARLGLPSKAAFVNALKLDKTVKLPPYKAAEEARKEVVSGVSPSGAS